MRIALQTIEGNPERERDALVRDLQRSLDGEVRFDALSRGLYATDGSNYRQVPIGVVVPRDGEDVAQALKLCRERGLPVLARGGGTSLAGQCCNTAVVFDFSKYMNKIISVDPDRKTVRVQPGCILDQVREHTTKEYGLRIGPDPSTHNHCTIGGMIGNNACGVHALLAELYGPGPRTEDNVEALRVLTYDGLELHAGETNEAQFQAAVERGGRESEIYRSLSEIRDRCGDLIRDRFPDIPRRVSGYSLPALLPENGFNVARSLVGSEGTLATTLEATMCLCPDFPGRALLVLSFEDIYEAGDAVTTVRGFRPIGLEGIDDILLRDVRQQGLGRGAIDYFPDGGGWLLVEFGAQSVEEARAQAEQAAAEVRRRGVAKDLKVYTDDEAVEAIWHIRETALGATAFTPDGHDSWPGWEDSAVPVDQVGTYLRELKKLYQRHDYSASLYGHFGQGCIHTRIDFEFGTPEGLDNYRVFTRAAAQLVTRLGGSLSGEHGDGQARSDLLSVMFGDELVTAFEEVKKVWDPDNKMNPGKVVFPDGRDEHLRIGPSYEPWEPKTYFAYPEDAGSFAHAALRCVGVGECRRTHGGTMCPSFMVTRDERDCTRGRARLLYEMTVDGVTEERWQSEEVKEALDLCLACKACKNECPVSVDMATYKAEFLSHYFESNARPRSAYAFGWIDRWTDVGKHVPNLINLASRTPGLRSLAKWTAGMAQERQIPKFAPQTFRAQFRRNGRGDEQDPPVMLFDDTFSNHFHPEVLLATAEVLRYAGRSVQIPRKRLCCGRPLYDYGMLDRAKKLWSRMLDTLQPAIEQGMPVVCVEPSCAAAFRDELPNLMHDDERAKALSESVYTLAEFLTEIDFDPPALDEDVMVHRHCHQHAIMGFEPDEKLLKRMCNDVAVLDSGCCGMAGSFGFESDHFDVSRAAGERVLLPSVREADGETLIATDGFSCQQQIRQLTDRTPLHLAQLIQRAVRARRDKTDTRQNPK